MDSQGQTHWLEQCDADSDCGGGELSCECGVCVATCDEDDACDVSGLETECFVASSGAVQSLCVSGPSSPPALCLEPCSGSCDDGQVCASGACVVETMSQMPDAGSIDSGAPPVDGGRDGGNVVLPNDGGGTRDSGAVDETRGPCAPQRFQGVGTCEPGPIYYWTGFGCYGLVACDCIGPDCDDGYPSEDACMAAHAECTQASVKPCGGLSGGAGCDPGEYCEMLPLAVCGVLDAGGTCQPIPTACEDVYEPVCTCGDEEYGNACEAAMAGKGISSFGKCAHCTIACTDSLPTAEIFEACAAIDLRAECMSFEPEGFPLGCRWVTAESEPCNVP
jgi:hypothetical protein